MTREITPLNEEQRRLVENSLNIVHQAIHKNIVVNETIYGFSYENLYQEGCIWLCKAAQTFQEDKGVKFATFASKVVVNGLRTYCRLMCSKQKRQRTVPVHRDEKNKQFALEQIPDDDCFEQLISEIDTLQLLHKVKQQYSGTAKLGIEAIEWKVKGFSGKEIADIYGVKPNLVGAWISRASSKLRENPDFIRSVGGCVEKAPR